MPPGSPATCHRGRKKRHLRWAGWWQVQEVPVPDWAPKRAVAALALAGSLPKAPSSHRTWAPRPDHVGGRAVDPFAYHAFS